MHKRYRYGKRLTFINNLENIKEIPVTPHCNMLIIDGSVMNLGSGP